VICAFIAEHKARFRVASIRGALTAHGCKIAPRTYYAWARRAPSNRALWDTTVTEVLAGYYEPDEHGRRRPESLYGSLKMWSHLRRLGVPVARCTVERLMRSNGWRGATRAKTVRTTVADPAASRAPDLVNRQFRVEAPNRLLVADFTYVRLGTGAFAYTVFVVDAYAGMIVGWECSTSKHTAFVERAIAQAVALRHRGGKPLQNKAIHHSDAGSQGGFRWSSQHLECGGVGWDDHPVGRRHGREDQLCGRRGGRRSISGRSSRRSGSASPRGLSCEDAALACGVSQPVGTRWFRDAGGMPPISLVPCSGRYLSFAEREEIALLRAQRLGVREIARRLGRSPSTISRELRRNAATRGGKLEYRATVAQWKADRAARRPKTAKLAENDRLRQYVQDRLAGTIKHPDGTQVPGPDVGWIGRRHGRRQDRRWATAWSPEQIANRLPLDFPDDESMRISHEAIYQALYVQGRGALRRELTACLRTGRALRVPRARTRGRGKRFVTPEVMISERPAEAEDRAVPGHWEGDLIIGLNSSAIGTLVERTTRFTTLLHLPPMDGHGGPRAKNGPALAGHGAEAVRDAIASQFTTLPDQLRRSLTWDQGAEMAQHAQIRIDTGLAIYFCDPRSPWQRGTNENTNGLLRQDFPKGTDLSRHSAEDLNAVAAALNGRPRKTLGWKTPAEALNEQLLLLQATGVASTP
jgi:IS30 family transposase